MSTIRLHALGLLSLFLSLSLTGCATAPVVRTETVKVNVPTYVALPAELTTPAPTPVFPVNVTNGALADYVLALQQAFHLDAAKLDKIRALQPGAADAVPTQNP